VTYTLTRTHAHTHTHTRTHSLTHTGPDSRSAIRVIVSSDSQVSFVGLFTHIQVSFNGLFCHQGLCDPDPDSRSAHHTAPIQKRPVKETCICVKRPTKETCEPELTICTDRRSPDHTAHQMCYRGCVICRSAIADHTAHHLARY